MSTNQVLRVRRSIQELQDDYTRGNKKPLEDLMRAWKGIKALPPEDPRSFFMLGGLHGEPFRGAGWGNASYWGGYCNHGNVLFPTWHRAYLFKLEQALQSIPDCADVMLPFWDEASDDSRANGIPWALTQKDFVLDGETIPNPLRSFVFNRNIKDHINGDSPDYSKPKGYETVRYPLSGLVGPDDIEATKEHNAKYSDYGTQVELLNQNVVAWLTSHIVVDEKIIETHVIDKYKACLEAPNYTVFSNTSSASQWNDDHPKVVPLESPHNDIHLSVGGFDIPGADYSPIAGANGDMGENDTAGLDPIFYFHHCFVDWVFWLWQQKHGRTNDLSIIPEYPGTNSVDNQGPTPGTVPNSWLTLRVAAQPVHQEGKGREGAALHVSRRHQHRDAARLHLRPRLAGGGGPAGGPAGRQQHQGAGRLRAQPGAHPRLLPGLRLRHPRRQEAPHRDGGRPQPLERQVLRQLPDPPRGEGRLRAARVRGGVARQRRLRGRGPHPRRPRHARRRQAALPPRVALNVNTGRMKPHD